MLAARSLAVGSRLIARQSWPRDGARNTLDQALAQRLRQLERGARVLQGAAGFAIIAIGALTLSQLRL
jgi:hypothetical protein